MGDIDLVKVVLDRIGDMAWMQIAIRPAKPFAFGLVGEGRTPVFGLPGNPVSSMVSYELLARPALRRMAGHPEGRWHRAPVAAVAAEAMPRRPDGKLHLARVVGERDGDGVLHVRSAGGQGSHQLTAMARAHGLALLPDGDGVAPATPSRSSSSATSDPQEAGRGMGRAAVRWARGTAHRTGDCVSGSGGSDGQRDEHPVDGVDDAVGGVDLAPAPGTSGPAGSGRRRAGSRPARRWGRRVEQRGDRAGPDQLGGTDLTGATW
jgi:hypothetical protein